MTAAVYEARLLAVLAHVYAVEARGYGTAPAKVDEVRALQTCGTVNFTAEQCAQIDSWYERTKRTFRLVGAKQEVTLENLPAAIDLVASERSKDQCLVKLDRIRDISFELEASVQCTLDSYRQHRKEAWDCAIDDTRCKWLEIRIADIKGARDIWRHHVEFGTRHFCEEDLKSLDKVLKQLEQWAEEQHGFEKLPDNVEGLSGANSGYPVGY